VDSLVLLTSGGRPRARGKHCCRWFELVAAIHSPWAFSSGSAQAGPPWASKALASRLNTPPRGESDGRGRATRVAFWAVLALDHFRNIEDW
jgi:hypothetical protein